MKKIVYIIGVLAVAISIGLSCSKDGLYLEDPNNMAITNFWKNEKDALRGLAGVYDAYQSNALMGKKYREFDHITDNAFRGNATGGWNNIDNDTHNASDAQVLSFWSNFYDVGARANEVIANVAKIPSSAISDASRKRIIAEAAFLRAYVYHDLTAIWGDVPIYLDPIKAFDIAKAPSTRQQVIDYFTNELETEIIPNLPPTLPEKGRVAQGAAQALLGKFYLLAEDYPKAATAFQAVINSNLYRLYPGYAKLFTPNAEFSSESLFEINFVGDAFDQGESFSSRVDTTLAAITPTEYWAPVRNLADSYLYTDGKPYSNAAAITSIYGARSTLFNSANPYANRDPRLMATFYTHLDINSKGAYIYKVNVNNPPNSILNSLAVKKYSTIGTQQYENGGPQNYYVIRYAEVLLSYAEAKNETLSVPDQSIYDAVNLIRRRLKISENLSGGKGTISGTTTNTPIEQGMAFNLTSPIVLKTVNINVPQNISGSITVKLQTATGTLLHSKTINIPSAGTATTLRVVTLPLFFNINAGDFTLSLTGDVPVGKESSSAYPYSLIGAGSIKGAYPSSHTGYNYFYNWQYDVPNSTMVMPDYPSGLTKAQMRQYIRDERRWEFGLEHQRFFDLKRWKDDNGDPLSLTLPPAANNNKKASKPRVYTWPYPQTEMDRNPELKRKGQNAGY